MIHLKRTLRIIGLATMLALLAPIMLAQEITGNLAAVKNLRVKVDMGSVVVRGGQQQGINYVVHTRFGTSSEQEARRQFEQYKITAYVKGDTAWIVGDWQGGRQPRHCSSEVSVMVPREMALLKLETEGGNVEATGVTGRVEAQSGGGSLRPCAVSATCTGDGSRRIGKPGRPRSPWHIRQSRHCRSALTRAAIPEDTRAIPRRGNGEWRCSSAR